MYQSKKKKMMAKKLIKISSIKTLDQCKKL